jgi:hypothetical protein
VEAGIYSLTDVVLPLPAAAGAVMLPTNKVATTYADCLTESGVTDEQLAKASTTLHVTGGCGPGSRAVSSASPQTQRVSSHTPTNPCPYTDPYYHTEITLTILNTHKHTPQRSHTPQYIPAIVSPVL